MYFKYPYSYFIALYFVLSQKKHRTWTKRGTDPTPGPGLSQAEVVMMTIFGHENILGHFSLVSPLFLYNINVKKCWLLVRVNRLW